MADWLDRWARRAGRPAGAPNSPDGARQLSRRQLLKRAGVIAGATWTVPMIQSAVAPAAAASGGGCISGCPAGSTCTTDANCASGLTCIGGICGQPGKAWTGTSCGHDNQCWSNVCNGHTCKPAELKAPCRTSTDCRDNVNCSATTQTCGGTGASCNNKHKCISEQCVNSVCV